MASKKVLIMFALLLSSVAVGANSCPFDRIYSFGSSSDDHRSNLLASKLHLPLPEPYTNNATTAAAAHVYGANFMNPSSTVMPRWFYFEKGIQSRPFNESLLKQLQSFENLLSPYCFSHDRCLLKLNKALFLFDQLGVNDYQHMLLHGKTILEVSKLVPQVVEAIKGKLEGLIRFGAQNLFVSGSPQMGCSPTKFRTSEEDEFHYDSTKCGIELNMFATLHNDHLQQALYELRHKYPHVRAVYMDYFKALNTRRNGGEAEGFNVSKRLMKLCGGSTEGGTHDQVQEDHLNPAKAKQCEVCRSVPSVSNEDPTAGLGHIHRGSFDSANKRARNIFNPLWQFM